MGGQYGGPIFDRTADPILTAAAPDEVKRACLIALIGALQDQGWNNELDSLRRFKESPIAVDAFEYYGIVLAEKGVDPDEIQRRERERIGAKLITRFEAMRETGDQDMRTVIAYVRTVTATPG